MRPVVYLTKNHLPFLGITVMLILGIVSAYHLAWSPKVLLMLSLAMVILFVVILILFLWTRRFRQYFGFALHLFVFVFAVWSYGRFNRYAESDFIADRQFSQLVGTLIDEPIVKERTIRFPVELQRAIDSMSTNVSVSGVVMVTVERTDILEGQLKYQSRIHFPGNIREVSAPANPHEFDYKQYLANKGIYHRIYLRSTDIKIYDSPTTIYSLIFSARAYFVERFRTFIADERAFNIAAALVFGYRSEMDQETLSAFTNTGTIHVLSVSGLHVTLVFGLLTFLLRPIDRYRYGRSIRFGFILVLIWLYVFLTGAAPPILRAGIMISFFIVSAWSGRQQISLNTLLASAFFILLFSPEMLFDVGFQLSYLAMLGIFLIYPLLNALYLPKRKIWKWVVQYSYVSVSAQLLTAPLALYYFHQFPTYFLIANLLIAIPSTLVMYVGIALMLIPVVFLDAMLGTLLEYLIWCMFSSLKYIDQLPFSTFQGIEFNFFQVVLMFIFIGAIFYTINYRSKSGLFAMLGLIVVQYVLILSQHYHMTNYSGARIYQVQKHIAIAQIHDGKVRLFHTFDSIPHPTYNYAVLPDLKKFSRVSDIEHVALSEEENQLLQLAERSVLLWNVGNYPDAKADVVLIRKNRKPSKDSRMSANIYILDGSNSTYTIDRWMSQFQDFGQDYYLLKNNYAYVWEAD